MGKKNFKSSFDDLLGGKLPTREHVSSVQRSKIRETKATFVITVDHLDKLRAISYLERKMIKDVLADVLDGYIDSYERSNGSIQLPKSH